MGRHQRPRRAHRAQPDRGQLGEGIFYEISQDATIRNNALYRNGFAASGWYWDGGITVASSSNVEVYGNRLSGNYNGITGTQQDRPDSTPPATCSTASTFTTT